MLAKWIAILLGISAVAVVATPMIVHQRKSTNMVTGISKLKGLSLRLIMFKNEYGRLPDETTEALVKSHTGTPLDLTGTSSNRLFRQLLLRSGPISEECFDAPIPGCHRADDRCDDDAHALEPGECGFAYLSSDHSNDWGPSAIIAVAPLISGTTRFDPEPFDGRAVVLRMDGGTSPMTIAKDGHVYEDGGRGVDIFDPEQSCWNGDPPKIHWRE